MPTRKRPRPSHGTRPRRRCAARVAPGDAKRRRTGPAHLPAGRAQVRSRVLRHSSSWETSEQRRAAAAVSRKNPARWAGLSDLLAFGYQAENTDIRACTTSSVNSIFNNCLSDLFSFSLDYILFTRGSTTLSSLEYLKKLGVLLVCNRFPQRKVGKF